jgi:RND family efflux transporter MFP subunit
LRRIGSTLLFAALLVALGLYATGAWRAKRPPHAVVEAAEIPAPQKTAVAERVKVPIREDAVGTVRSRRTVEVAAQVMARVDHILVEPGQSVKTGEALLQLDARELAARLAQARQAFTAAESAVLRAEQSKAQSAARLGQARAHVERMRKLAAEHAATTEALEAAESDFLQAQAGVSEAEAMTAVASAQRGQAADAVHEAEIALGYAAISSPIDGIVAERRIETGDLALPGHTLVVVLDPGALRLEARVREGLVSGIHAGQTLEIEIPSARAVVPGKVSVVLPTAEARSRTFEVRVDFEAREGIHAGMFGRLRMPAGEREIVRVPSGAVVRVGQLETILVREGEHWRRRLVTTGAHAGDGTVEILSGLTGNEVVGISG